MFRALFISFLIFTSSLTKADHQIVSTVLAPWSLSAEEGMVTEVVKEIEKRIGTKVNIQILPWTRSQKLTQKGDNFIIYPLTRIQKREKKYKWIVKVKDFSMAFAE